MPIPFVPIALAGAAGIGAVAVAIKAKHASDRAALAAECESIRTSLEALAATGGDPHTLELQRVALADCARRAAAAGITLSAELTTLVPCRATRAFMNAQWADYRRTSYSDPISRDNKRNAILSQGAALVQCLSAALSVASTPAAVSAVLADIRGAAADSGERAACLTRGSDGCGRFGVNEESGTVRARKELETIGLPLGVRWSRAFDDLWGFDRESQAEFRRLSGLPAQVLQPQRGGRMGIANVLVDGEHGGLTALAEAKLLTVSPLARVAVVATSGEARALLRGPLDSIRLTLGG